MDTLQIEKILQEDPYTSSEFIGVYARDQFPVNPKLGAYVLNTDPSTYPGEHWLAVYSNTTHVEFFDSYGQPPPSEDFQPFLKSFHLPIIYNNQQIQGLSTMCGQYCIFYLLHRCRGWTLPDILNIFRKKKFNHNDMFINFFINKHFNLQKAIMEPLF